MFQREVLPAVDELVKEGGPYEGYVPIFRGDNAGQHQEKTKGGFDTFCAEYCEVWNEYPSSAIARGHILAYRLMKKALEINGGNDYLGNGLHCNVRRDFIDCDKGVRLKDGRKMIKFN